MMRFAKNSIRTAFRLRGIELVSSKTRFGVNPWADIRRLATIWKREIATAFDVGANDGETTASLLSEFRSAAVTSFEPQAMLAGRLVHRFARNPRVRVERLALGDRDGVVEFFEYEHDKVASLSPNAPYAVRFGPSARATEVPCTTLDLFCERNGIERIDVLKIDTEGHDHLVLEGAREMIARRRVGFVLTEFNTLEPSDGQFGGSLNAINRLLDPAGFRFVTSYTDHVVDEPPMFMVSNALFALPPDR